MDRNSGILEGETSYILERKLIFIFLYKKLVKKKREKEEEEHAILIDGLKNQIRMSFDISGLKNQIRMSSSCRHSTDKKINN